MDEIELRYGEISDEQRRRIIRICAMTIMQNVDKSDSKLRQNKEGAKEFVFKTELAKNVGMRTAMLEMQFADFIAEHMLQNKELYIELPTYRREKRLLEEMEKMGVIIHLEPEQTKQQEQVEQIGDNLVQPEQRSGDVIQSIQPEGEQPKNNEGKSKKVISIEEVISLVEQQAATIPSPTKPKTRDEELKMKVDFAKLNNHDLLLTNRKTGKKEIQYGRYSDGKTQTHIVSYQDRQAILKRVGKLTYKTVFMMIADIEEYLIRTPEMEREVFTYGLNIGKLEKEEQYRKIFFEQLISPENLDRQNNNGYIGSIIPTRGEDKYKVDYSQEEYTAVTELKERLDKMRADRVANDKEDR